MFEIRTILSETRGFISNPDDFDQALDYYGEDRNTCILKKCPEFALCRGRHEMPCDEAIFDTIEDPTDTMGLYRIACDVVEGVSDSHGGMVVYVTGLTVALVAVINACRDKKVNLLLKHFDRNTGDYYDQWVGR